MRQTTGMRKSPGEKIVKDIKRATRPIKARDRHNETHTYQRYYY